MSPRSGKCGKWGVSRASGKGVGLQGPKGHSCCVTKSPSIRVLLCKCACVCVCLFVRESLFPEAGSVLFPHIARVCERLRPQSDREAGEKLTTARAYTLVKWSPCRGRCSIAVLLQLGGLQLQLGEGGERESGGAVNEFAYFCYFTLIAYFIHYVLALRGRRTADNGQRTADGGRKRCEESVIRHSAAVNR